MRITMVRHGETDFNKKRLIQGHIDLPLNSKGLKQAKEIGKSLKTNQTLYDYMMSSPLKRALQTAQHIAIELNYPHDIIINPNLIERKFGSMDGKKIDDVLALIGSNYQSEDYENDQTLIKRVIQTLFELEQTYKDKHVLAVVHSQVIKAVFVHLYPNEKTFVNFTVPNAQAYDFIVEQNHIISIKK